MNNPQIASSVPKRKGSMIYPLLRYLGKIAQPENSEYGFHIESEDESIRLLILSIPNSLFLSHHLMVQEAPDLCYQMALTDLQNETTDPIKNTILITGSDIEHYRAIHPNLRRKSYRKPL
jgi:hypothetical protein